jgi:anti-sigma regulatory factor (Ser/Thr protein kinase)
VVLSPVILLDTESRKLEKLIEVENTELAKEIAVFEQKLWVFKRRWLFMLHGTVQSALTAALTRLQTFAESDPYQVSLVQADLERAEVALKSVPSNDIDFGKATTELKESWAGVCAITVKEDMRASRALATNKGTAYCVNEILKEAIGNAVRHGSATAVMVNITREEDDFVDVEIQNDGSAPPKRRKKGIGSRMLDDVTLNWSLSRSGRLTTLTARLPL